MVSETIQAEAAKEPTGFKAKALARMGKKPLNKELSKKRSQLIQVQTKSVKMIQVTEAQLEKLEEDQVRSKAYHESLVESIQEQVTTLLTESCVHIHTSLHVSDSRFY